MEQDNLDLQKILSILNRRKRLFSLGFGTLFFISVLVVWLWPPSFRSTATILIEEQEVPMDLVRSTITTFADQQIAKIKQQVMTRSNLLRIVEQFDLYASLRQRSPNEVILKRFVDDIHVKVISADVVDRRTGQPTKATIAFTLAYDGESPSSAQKVATELTNLFLAENLKTRERKAQEATEFLQREANDLSARIEELGKQIANFKQDADGALPELFEINLQMMNQADRQVMDIRQRLVALEDRKIDLEGQLAIIKPNTPMITASGERILDMEERLKALRAQYVSSAALFSPTHPDIIKMQQEIHALERATGPIPVTGELQKRLADEHALLQTRLKTLGDDHPDIKQSRAVIVALERELLQLASNPRSRELTGDPENPAYIQIQSQLNATVNEINSLKRTERILQEKIQTYSTRLEETPGLEPAYLELTRNRENSTKKYHEIRFKLLEAKVSQELEEQRKGERFSLIDPPDFPEQPDSPNRLVIMVLGIILSVFGGVGAVVVAENLDQSIRSSQDLTNLTKMAPLANIPYLPIMDEIQELARRRRFMKWAGMGGLVSLILLSHWFWLPFDVVWYAALRKLGLG